MKTSTIIALLVLATLTGLAQTNYGTVSFTNRYGSLIQGEVIRVDASKIQVKSDNIISTIKLVDTPTEIQTRFGFDADVEAAAARARAEKMKRLVAHEAAAKNKLTAQTDLAIRRRDLEQKAVVLYGRVVQRLDDQLLVDCAGNASRGYQPAPEYRKWMAGKSRATERERMTEKGLILLVDFPGIKNTADDDAFITVAYPIGTHVYTAVSGGKKTVRKYTCNIDVALAAE